MNMKHFTTFRVMAMGLMLLFTTSMATAGDGKDLTPEQRTQKQVKMLNLNANQTVKVRALNKKYADVLGDKPDGMKKNSKAYNQRKKLRKSYRKEFNSCLTPQQAKQYAEYSKEKKMLKNNKKSKKKGRKTID